MHSFLDRSFGFHAFAHRKNSYPGVCCLGKYVLVAAAFFGLILSGTVHARAQSANTASIVGTVKDPSGSAVANATVDLSNPVSGFQRSTSTGTDGSFQFTNVPFNPYHLLVTANGFSSYTQDVDARSGVPMELNISLKISTGITQVTVTSEAADLVEQTPTDHTDVDRGLFDRLPLESSSSSVSSLITLATPGIAADSNGLFHGMGDHAENSFSVDGQPITDQQSKIFSNQIPLDSIASLEVVPGAPPAEYGGKTSVIINVTTRSGQGVSPPHGTVTVSYGTFGSADGSFQLGYGGPKWGNFISGGGLNTSRFLDPPEFTVFHDRGNQENLFDRVDYQFASRDSIHLNFGYTRSWFQNPNTYDQQLHTCSAGFACDANGNAINPLNGAPLGRTDQRSQIKTFNIAPTWTRLVGTNTVFTFGGFARKDQYNYYPSFDPFADFSPALQAQTIRQDRKLTNLGLRSDVSYVKTIHNVKAGVAFQHTLLTENDNLGTVDSAFLNLFNQVDSTGAFIPGTTCLDASGNPVSAPCTILAPSDLTRGGSLFNFHGHTDVKEVALYAQDAITRGNWSFNIGLRADIYRGLSRANQAEPRLGVAYNIKRTNTVLRFSYARSMESPFNENLIIANTGCSNPVVSFMVPPPNIQCGLGAISPGRRNEFHAGLAQAFGRYLVVDGEYVWKFTQGAYDFGVVAATPIAFPIEWHNSKIPGFAVRVRVPTYHGFSALVVMSSVAARFFNPQIAGIPFLPAANVFRIDHDERFNQTTHLEYQPWKRGPWVGFNWRYDSGLVAGATPCSAPTPTCSFTTSPFDAPGIGLATINGQPLPAGQVAFVNNLTGLPMTADQEFQGGFTCNGQPAAPSPVGPALPSCSAAGLASTFIRIPAFDKENDDHNPQRIQPRSLFDLAVGDDNLFHGDRYKWSLRLTVVNIGNKKALYNFFSTFSGTHYLTPRAFTAELGFHF